ncbi:MAG: hypothetical protein WC867_06630 [Candidatus Pacearchaeota archaeon]|jgi:hypothetical protein
MENEQEIKKGILIMVINIKKNKNKRKEDNRLFKTEMLVFKNYPDCS